MCPQYESPPITDLLSQATSCTPSDKSGRIAYKDDKSVKVHKDTTAWVLSFPISASLLTYCILILFDEKLK